ncbi:hypothetical protein PQX77_009886 [Marasmius sp. AFHP31]|nr:hypothetical protein PQX77_009886 [Marasmius sp. AFHP31]
MPLLKDLADAALNYPAIDNHAHPLLKEEYKDEFPLEHLVSEASGNGLIEDTPHTLAFIRATKQLAPILGLEKNAHWEEIKFRRNEIPYLELCNMLMDPCKIQCLLLDDGLGGVEEFAEGLEWHSEQFCDTRRIVRVEVEAETVLKELINQDPDQPLHLSRFQENIRHTITDLARDPTVVGFKSVVCYRTGLDVSPTHAGFDAISFEAQWNALKTKFIQQGTLRLEVKFLNDLVVRTALEVAGEYDKPGKSPFRSSSSLTPVLAIFSPVPYRTGR